MSLKRSLAAWFNSEAADADPADERIDWARILPFIGLHLACLGVIWVGVSVDCRGGVRGQLPGHGCSP